MTSHFEESTMIGTFAISGSEPMSCRKRVIAATPSIRLVHADVDHVGAVVDLLAGDGNGLLVVAGFDKLRKFRRAGDVGALANHEISAATGVKGSEPESAISGFTTVTLRAGFGASACAMAAMCSACCRSSRRRCCNRWCRRTRP